MRCPSCNHDNPGDASFCEECGAKLELICPACKASVSPGARFCKKCGTAIGPTKAAASTTVSSPKSQILVGADGAASEAIVGERKTVTALFADIKGSTELMEDLDPEEARAIIDPALKLMIEAVGRYGGYVVQSTGDGIFALFGAPVAHEDHPQRALYAALRMQDELKRHSDRLRADGGLPIQARIGVNTGEVVVRSITTGTAQTEYTPIGHTTNLASRMQTLAPIGSIAATEATRRLCEGYFTLKALGATKVKGVSEPVNVYEVTGLGLLRTRLQRAAGRGLTKFVGREREMEALRHAAEQAKSGHGQIVAAMAEPGVGKSRLFFEFKATSRSGCMVLETFSVSHGKASAYLPVLDLLQSYFKIAGEDDERTRREKVNGKVLTLDRSLEDTLPYLFSLLAIVEDEDPLAQMDGQLKKRRTLEAIKRVLLCESLNQPLMVVFEDLHWIDEQTQEFLNLLANSIGTVKILLLVNYRPEYSHHWNSKTYYTQLRLDPLGQESAGEMLSALLTSPAPATQSPGASREKSGGDMDVAGRVRVQDSMEGLKRLIIEKTEGNPFFMEEAVQVLFDEGALVRDGAAVRLTKPLNALKIPPTVQGILAARIDRLPADAKELLQTLAVIGREFPISLIGRVWQHPHPRDTAPAQRGAGAALALSRQSPSPHLSRNTAGEGQTDAGEEQSELNRLLNDLQLGEFIYEQPAVGDTEYIFKHALTQEVAYNSVLLERRQQLHERAGAALETLHTNLVEEHLPQLAHHYGRSANPGKAVPYLTRAGQQALNRSAFAEAQAQLQQGLEWIMKLSASAERDARELELASTLAKVLTVTRGFSALETRAAAEHAQDLAEKTGNLAQLVAQVFGIWRSVLNAGDYSTASLLADRILALAQREGSPASFGFACFAQMCTSFFRADLIDAEEHFARLSGFLDADGFRQVPAVVVGAMATAGVCAGALGHADLARARLAQAVAFTRDSNNPYDRALGRMWESWLSCWLREPQRAEVAAAQALAIAEEHGFPFIRNFTLTRLGWARAQLGRAGEGVALIGRGLSGLAEAGVRVGITDHLTHLAEAQALDGNIDGALITIDEALQKHPEELVFRPNALTCRGELRLKLGRTELAEADFRQAIALAQKMKAKAWELRATISVARPLRDSGRRDEARAMLSEIYNWFAEGFDTADLQNSKALLGELGN
jgi:class 3 adenylate cyclase/tetratricopeptide (TPR) repeat protein